MLAFLKNALARRGVIVYRHSSPDRDARFRFINLIREQRSLLLSHVEAEQLVNAVLASSPVPGELAEVGTFRGASARLLREYSPRYKNLHVFDTFEGLPQPGAHDADFRRGDFSAGLEEVKSWLGTDGIRYHVGMFPQTATDEVRGIRFSFVHLDVDLYNGTLECLGFFYPRMNPGGILVSHDFGAPRAPGVEKAFAEYFGPLGVPYIRLSGYQGMAVKLG